MPVRKAARSPSALRRLGAGSLALALAASLVPPLLAARASGGEPSSGETDGEVARICSKVASLRARAFARPVTTTRMGGARAATRLVEIATAEGARCSRDVERALGALGFLDARPRPSVTADAPPERDERDESPPACGLAFYDQIRKEVVLVDGRSTPEEREEVLAHEVSHALQDQCFDLRARLRTISRTASADHDSEELAVNAAINEGEATVLELLYVWMRGDDRSWIQGVPLGDPLGEGLVATQSLFGEGRDRRLRDGMRSVARGARLAWTRQRAPGARRYFQTVARFQYVAGAAFVAEAYLRGGWEAVSALRTRPPRSTSQVLHPESYFESTERPASLPASGWLAARPGLRLLYENRLGELGLSIVTEDEAAGWKGDVCRVLARPDGSLAVEWRALLDDATKARTLMAGAPRWHRAMSLAAETFDVLDRRGAALVGGAGLRKDELASFLESAWKAREDDAFASELGAADRTLALAHRAEASPDCELRVLGAAERPRAASVLAAHLDAHREGTLETDGESWGLRSREGGGFSWVESRKDGRLVVATARDRSALRSTRDALEAALPSKAPVEKK